MAKQRVGGGAHGAPYSPGIISRGAHVYVSGQVPVRDGRLAGTGVAEQTEVVLANLAAVLEEAGASLADVVRCGVFLADPADFAAMNAVYTQTFPEPLPARTTVAAPLMLPGALVEIDCVAVLPQDE